MRKTLSAVILSWLVFSFSSGAFAQTPTCDPLAADKKALAQKIIDSSPLYGACRGTIREGLAAKPACPLAKRLAENICQHVAKGETEEKIRKRLDARAESMAATVAATDIAGFEIAGDKNAPVTVVVYACSRCPFCSKLIPQLHAVVTGPLKGKVRLVMKPFPLKSHELSKEGGLAMLAALQLGRFWPFVLKMYAEFNSFRVEKLSQQAEAVGMDGAQFKKLMDDPKTLERLVNLKKEGLAIGVDATPTLFINGRRYSGFLDIYEITDVLEEVAEAGK